MTETVSSFKWLRAVPLVLGIALLFWSLLYSIPVIPHSAGPPLAQMRSLDAEQAFREHFEKAWEHGLGPTVAPGETLDPSGEEMRARTAVPAFMGRWGAWAKLQPGPYLAGASLAWVVLCVVLLRRRKPRAVGEKRPPSPYLIAASVLLSVVLIACTVLSREMAISLDLAAAAPDVLISSWLVMIGILVMRPRTNRLIASETL